MNLLKMELGSESYHIRIGCGLLEHAGEYFNLNRRVFILTDSGVPEEYAEKLLLQCQWGKIYNVPEGEDSKSMPSLEKVLHAMLDFGLSREDALVSVGGGMVGDLGGFAAASYMRGIDFYQVPTTFLSQVDSSIGGKCAVNLGNVKNVVGAFYQPKGVLVDIDTLSTLTKRLIAEGLAESIKMALTSDAELFSILERESLEEIKAHRENIILGSLLIKKKVVEKDEKENGLRKILNFGHTLGHGIEAESGMCVLYHGECVALGMLPMCSDEVKARLIHVLEKLDLPTRFDGDLDSAIAFVAHDKKCRNGSIDVITVPQVGTCEIKQISVEEYKKIIKERMPQK